MKLILNITIYNFYLFNSVINKIKIIVNKFFGISRLNIETYNIEIYFEDAVSNDGCTALNEKRVQGRSNDDTVQMSSQLDPIEIGC